MSCSSGRRVVVVVVVALGATLAASSESASQPSQEPLEAVGVAEGAPRQPTQPTGTPAGDRRWAVQASTATDISELVRLDRLVDSLAATKELTLVSQQPDRQLSGRVHEGFLQHHEGMPVYGGAVSRQLDRGVTISIFGTIHRDIDVDTVPRLSADEALVLIERRAGVGPATVDPPELVVLPHPFFDTYVLAYRATMRDLHTYLLDAHTGAVVHVESGIREQGAAVGVGLGITGDRKKVSTSQAGGGFQAYDRLRPAEIVTLDLRYNENRAERLIDPRGISWRPSDVASDPDNNWADTAVVDGHGHMGFTYDYLAARHGWDGMDGKNGRILGMVNIARDYDNAFFAHPPAGPERTGVVAFGQEDNGTPIVSADVVAHEIMHGVTYFSVKERTGEPLLDRIGWVSGPRSFRHEDGRTLRCGRSYLYFREPHRLAGRRFYYLCDRDGRYRLYMNHGGAINEAYSDIIGTAVEFSVQEPGAGPNRADYVMFEDSGPPARSLQRPRSIALAEGSPLRYPDNRQVEVRFLVAADDDDAFFARRGSVDRRTIVRTPSIFYGGEHWNSTILSHAFYLAIEGGRNETSGHFVSGVGGANRGDVERVFFRAMTELMPSSVWIRETAPVIRQSAIDLFGAGSATYRAVDQALAAVGL